MFLQIEQVGPLGPTRVLVVLDDDEKVPDVDAVKAMLLLAFIRQGFSLKEDQIVRLERKGER